MRTINTRFILFSAASLCAIVVGAEELNPVVILRRTTAAPTIAYQGVVTVGIRQGQESRLEEVNVRFKPPNLYRWEYIAPDGKVERVVVSHKEPGLQLAKQEWDLLLSNYTVNVRGMDNILGRPVWQLELIPRVAGKCHRQLSIDQQTGVILENKKFRPNHKEIVVSRFVRFDAPAAFPDSLFDQKNAPVKETPGVYERVPTVQRGPLPQTLPTGFQLVSASAMQVGDNLITQMRYTDGLSVISVFETVRPVNATAPQSAAPSVHHVISRQVSNGHVTLISDMSNDLLNEISLAFNK